jgi:hypothetical protein
MADDAFFLPFIVRTRQQLVAAQPWLLNVMMGPSRRCYRPNSQRNIRNWTRTSNKKRSTVRTSSRVELSRVEMSLSSIVDINFVPSLRSVLHEFWCSRDNNMQNINSDLLYLELLRSSLLISTI